MNPKTHRILTQVFLAFNSLFWLPWGFINLVWPKSWAGDVIPGMNVYDLSNAVARTEVRAMYGGLQMAIGLFALLGVLRPKYRDAALTFFVIALTGLSLCRLGGMIAEGEQQLPVVQHQDHRREVQPDRPRDVRVAEHDLRLDPLRSDHDARRRTTQRYCAPSS